MSSILIKKKLLKVMPKYPQHTLKYSHYAQEYSQYTLKYSKHTPKYSQNGLKINHFYILQFKIVGQLVFFMSDA